MAECQYLGPEFDARTWDYFNKPTPYCGCRTLEGKNYCHEHYYVVYKKGSATGGKRIEREIDREIEQLKRQQEIEEIENE